jgi:uncharacterized protein (TIGR03435 family)
MTGEFRAESATRGKRQPMKRQTHGTPIPCRLRVFKNTTGYAITFRRRMPHSTMRTVFLLLAALPLATQLFGQPDLASKSFEVASVKRLLEPSASRSSGGGPGTSDPGRWWRSNVTLASLLTEAFHIQAYAIVGPDWLVSTRYEIAAKVPIGANRDDIPLMLQKLIAEPFGMTFHREQKEVPGYALVIGRNGPRLKSSSDSPARIPGRDGFPDFPEGVAPGVIQVDSAGSVHRLAAGAMSTAQLADYLAAQTGTPVNDLSELRGKYDIILYFSKPLPISANPSATLADDRIDLLAALREQLGLELQRRKVRADLFVIDHIEQTPSAN